MNEKTPSEIMEDWQSILQRPGMSVLATFLKQMQSDMRAKLESNTATDDYAKVCEVRGELYMVKKVIRFVKSEFDRAAKGDTPEKETK